MALIVALAGTAYAASRLTKGQKKEVEKIAKKYAGKPGAPGAPGAKGDTGLAGSNGSNGTNGEKGATGAPGATGKSVVLGTIPTGVSTCNEQGGATVEVEGSPATKKNVCNGEEGEPGILHPGETLPPGATETGSWLTTTSTELAPGFFSGHAAISFPIPLPSAIAAERFVVKKDDVVPEQCDDGVEPAPGPEHPEAAPGALCVFIANSNPASHFINKSGAASTEPGASTAGAIIVLVTTAEEEVWGTFAVTGEEP
jgi:Collagen triple helix repeat (20 copies)